MAMTSPVFNANGNIVLRYVNGSVCDEDKSLNYNSKITFKCKPGAFPGEPFLGDLQHIFHLPHLHSGKEPLLSQIKLSGRKTYCFNS
jgi:hypothetical protein